MTGHEDVEEDLWDGKREQQDGAAAK